MQIKKKNKKPTIMVTYLNKPFMKEFCKISPYRA